MERIQTDHTNEESSAHYLRALQVLEEKYRRGEIRLDDLLYGYDQMQAKFYRVINPDRPDYHSTYQAAVTHEGHHYTKLKAVAPESISTTEIRALELTKLLERIGRILDRETIDRALQALSDPKLSDEDFRSLCSLLVSKAIRRLNGD